MIPRAAENETLDDRCDAPPTEDELLALANFRYTLRRFLSFSEQASAELGLTPQRYQALLVIKTYRAGRHISVGELAEQLMIRDHSAAELVSRLVQAKLVRRKNDPADRRRSLVVMTPFGDRRLSQLASVHLEKLRASREAFLNLFTTHERETTGGDGEEVARLLPVAKS